MAIDCFHRGAASLMFGEVLNATLSEEKVSFWCYTGES